MIVTLNMCMPEDDAMRQRFGERMALLKRDNRAVIAAMRGSGTDVPDTMIDLGLPYVPETHRTDAYGQPVMELYGIHDMMERGKWSCGDGSSWEAAVLEEKYGVPTLCIAVAQGDDDQHGVFVTAEGAVDPVANYHSGRRSPIPRRSNAVTGSSCTLQDGRVICVEPEVCAVDENGRWNCPGLPSLSGRRAEIGRVIRTPNGQAYARMPNGAVVPVRRSRR